MKFIFACVAIISVAQATYDFLPRHGIPPPNPPKERSAIPTWGLILQKQDNFDKSNNNVWNMRYISNGQFYEAGGPVFIMLGAEWTINEGWLQTGQMYDMAKTHKAQMYYTEHRYYGESFPTSDLSTDNLKYLSVDQALADVANFIEYIKQENPELAKSKVVVFGGSYGGTMAIWMREKYPHLVHAAYSSSAPLLAKADFHEYNKVVQGDLGAKCSAVINRGIMEVLYLIQSNRGYQVEKDFHLCSSINPKDHVDISALISNIFSRISSLVQYANYNTIPTLCKSLENPSTLSDYERLAKYIKHDEYCIGDYESQISYYKQTSLESGAARPWFYQTCAEFGFFQTSSNYTSLYGPSLPVQYYHKMCQDIFGPSFNSVATNNGIMQTNKKYGALNPDVSRVVSIHGDVDPWHAIGLSDDLGLTAPVIVVPGASHCQDLHSASYSDSKELFEAKESAKQYIDYWLRYL